MRILIADDSIVSRHLLDATLRKWGYEVVVACDGNEAWHILEPDDTPTLVIADLDHFKSVNDTYGHFAGDAVLRECVRRMGGSVRPYDSIGRYGGEEFLVILPGCDEDCTGKQAERMREALANDPMSFNEESRVITCSYGATSWTPGAAADEESLIRSADDALYRAQRQGRNRVVFMPCTTTTDETQSSGPGSGGQPGG